jgi:hypothetical protein
MWLQCASLVVSCPPSGLQLTSSGDLIGLQCDFLRRHLLSCDYSTFTLYHGENHKQDTAHSLASDWKVYVYV